MTRTKHYTVRRPGCTAWVERVSLATATREAEIANRTVAPGHEITEVAK